MALPLPDQTKALEGQELTVLLAMLLFGEARGQHDDCKCGVASVVRNRVLSGKFGGDKWENVILARKQFSSFNVNDPNRAKLMEPLKWDTEAVWNACYQIANGVLSGLIPDSTRRATHYHSYHDPLDSRAAWAVRFIRTVTIGPFHFFVDPMAYREEPQTVPDLDSEIGV